MSEIKFQSLLPKSDVNLDSYKSALDFAMDDPTIRNIALLGSYGSGKSSVINSYEKTCHDDKKFLHISLADFSKDDRTPDTKDTIKLLEGKILNQLLHQLKPNDIKQSRFTIKLDTPTRDRIHFVFFCTIYIFMLLYTIRFESWKDFVATLPPGPWLFDISWTACPTVRVITLLICFFMGGWALFYLMQTYDFRSIFKKLDIKGVIGFEVFENSEDSFFNKYLNEVLYLFEKASVDAIVFEDLDRYDVVQIFEELKEISDLLYYRKQNRESETTTSKVPLKFFYLIRDDVFSSSDRTKFFDFIIPIIPIIATGNAYDLMVERFNDLGMEDSFDKHFLRDVSLYLSDLRLVHNIINEYILYQETLDSSNLNRNFNNQLAIIIYKNLFPKDFEQLQHGQGYVFNILKRQSDLLIFKRSTIDEEELKLKTELETLHKEHLQDVDELNALFFPFQGIRGEIYQINGKTFDQNQNPSRKELIKLLLQADNAYYIGSNNRSQSLQLKNLREQMENNSEYQNRKALLESKENHKISIINAQLARLYDERHKLNTLTLSELIDVADDRFWNQENCDLTSNEYFPLLKYLISQGYINEHYTFYISYFHPNSLTAHDMNFRIALNSHHTLGYDYTLDNPAAVLDWIDDSYFTRDELSNYDLFNYLIEHNCTKELYIWIEAIDLRQKLNPSAFEFPIALWRQTSYHSKLAGIINEKMPHWFQLWTSADLIDDDEWCKYAIDTLFQSKDSVLEMMNSEEWLSTAISARKNFLQSEIPQIETLIEKFQIIGVKFHCIDFREQDATLIRRVYEENLYALEEQTLLLWLILYYGAPSDMALKKSYTYLIGRPDEPLSHLVEENITIYMDALLNIKNLRFLDNPEVVVSLLNHPDIELNQKKAYINSLDTHIEMLEKIMQQELWPDLLQAKLVPFTWENIADYYLANCAKSNNIDEILLNFLEDGDRELLWNFDKLNERIGTDATDKLLDNLLECTELSLKRYRSIWATTEVQYAKLPNIHIADEYISVLIELNIIEVTTDNVLYIRQSYPNYMTNFLLNDNGAAIVKLATVGEVSLTESEITALLEDQRMTESIALPLLKAYSNTLSIVDTTYPEFVKKAIIEEHFSTDDIRWLLTHFDEQSKAIQSAFTQWAKANFSLIATVAIEIELIPILVYAMCLDDMGVKQAEELRKFLPNPDFEIVCTSNEAKKFPYTEDIRLILEFFKQNTWISHYQKRRNSYYAIPNQKESLEV